MKIATLQFAPSLGKLGSNIDKANAILEASKPTKLDLLVLPELAFTGYNFPSLEAIKPFLEPTTAGPTTEWAVNTAKRLRCHVCVGYPETDNSAETTTNYNSVVTVSPTGQILANYRKAFLYYTDELWASEGDAGFYCGSLGTLGDVGMGICMDINPYQFKSAWTAYEFANHCLSGGAKLVVLSMAWLTRLTAQDLNDHPEKPDMETVAYWLERFFPLVEAARAEPLVVVFGNRCGTESNRIEGAADVVNGVETVEGEKVAYAGSSSVMVFQGGDVRIFDMLGKGDEKLLVVNTSESAKYALAQKGTT